MLLVLPAALVSVGRWAFWPKVPRQGQTLLADTGSRWRRIGDTVAVRPAATVLATLVVLGALASGFGGRGRGLGPRLGLRGRHQRRWTSAWPPETPLLAFLFLVALGVDYSIFLVIRAREEAVEHGTREGMLRALAAVFAVLGVLPLVVLAQIGTVICIGVLLDTLVVRTLLVPAPAQLLGERSWWPCRVHSTTPG